MRKLSPIHPGEVLGEEFMRPMSIRQSRLAREIGVPAPRINAIVQGKRSISADTALRLARALGTSPDFWLNLQKRFELRTAEIELGAKLKAIKPIANAG